MDKIRSLSTLLPLLLAGDNVGDDGAGCPIDSQLGIIIIIIN